MKCPTTGSSGRAAGPERMWAQRGGAVRATLVEVGSGRGELVSSATAFWHPFEADGRLRSVSCRGDASTHELLREESAAR